MSTAPITSSQILEISSIALLWKGLGIPGALTVLTFNMERSKSDRMKCCDSRKKQHSRQACIANPLLLACKDTGRDQDVVSAKVSIPFSPTATLQCKTYRYRVPGPYCPDTGHAQTTSRTGAVTLTGGAVLRASRFTALCTGPEGNTGITLSALRGGRLGQQQ